MIKIAHIAPTRSIVYAENRSNINLVLAHLVGENEYTKQYAASKLTTIMDNGAFELGESISPELLIEKAKLVNAEYIVLPDYPKQNWEKTIKSAQEYTPLFKEAGFKTFFVPQSEVGDFDGYISSWAWAINNPDIDLIGCSILGAPNALPNQDRLIARYIVLRLLKEEFPAELLKKRIHMLGMLDTVHEISLTKPFHWMINSWDTSAAVWAGMNDFDISKLCRKFDVPVDFEAHDLSKFDMMVKNMDYINSLLK